MVGQNYISISVILPDILKQAQDEKDAEEAEKQRIIKEAADAKRQLEEETKAAEEKVAFL